MNGLDVFSVQLRLEIVLVLPSWSVVVTVAVTVPSERPVNNWPSVLVQFEVPRERLEYNEFEPFDHSKLSCVEAIPFESEALTTKEVLRPIVSLAAG